MSSTFRFQAHWCIVSRSAQVALLCIGVCLAGACDRTGREGAKVAGVVDAPAGVTSHAQPVAAKTPAIRLTEYSRRTMVSVERLWTPTGVSEVAGFVRQAIREHRRIRIRGRGHNLAGLTLPRGVSEVVLSTNLLNEWIVDPDRGTVRAGAGIPLYQLRQHLRALGYGVRVVNHGEMSGPSVGGYVAAGGFGNGSETYGGYWATVSALTVVDGTGTIHHLSPEDEAFWWMFGSMGELGVIVDVTLRIDVLDITAVTAGVRSGRLALPPPLTAADYPETIYWFTIFCPPAQQAQAARALQDLTARFPDALRWRPAYHYRIAASPRHPPLVYGGTGALAATGIWGDPVPGTTQRLPYLTAAVRDLVAAHPEWRRYVQTEYTNGPEDYAAALPAAVRARFDRFRRRFDPHDIFPDVIPAP